MERMNEAQIALLKGKFKQVNSRKQSKVGHIFAEINTLGKGDGLFVSKEEWVLKSSPSTQSFPRQLRTGDRKYQINTLQDNTGFVVIRIA